MYRDAFYQGGVFNGGEFASHWTVDTVLHVSGPARWRERIPPSIFAAELALTPMMGLSTGKDRRGGKPIR